MAIKIHVPGAMAIQVGTGTSAALETLGYTVNGVDIQENEFVEEVKSDRFGGSGGPPIDVQHFGIGATIDMELPEFEMSVFLKLNSRLANDATISANPGRAITPGTLIFAESGLFRVLMYGTKDLALVTAGAATSTVLSARNYPFCRVASAVGFNLGTRAGKIRLKFEAYLGTVSSNVVLWNRTVS